MATPQFAIDMKLQGADDVTVWGAYSGARMGADCFITNSQFEVYEAESLAVRLQGNRAHIANTYIFGSIGTAYNIKDIMVTNCDIWLNWMTPATIWIDDTLTSIQYRHLYHGNRIYSYPDSGIPMIDWSNVKVSGHQVVGNTFSEGAGAGCFGIKLGSGSRDILIADNIFGNRDGAGWDVGDWHIDAEGVDGLIIKDNLHTFLAGDVGGVNIHGDATNVVIDGETQISDGDLTSSPFINVLADGVSDMEDITIRDIEARMNSIGIQTAAAAAQRILGLVLDGNNVGGAIIDDADDAIIRSGRIGANELTVRDSQRPQILNITSYAAAGAGINLLAPMDEAWVHGCSLPAVSGAPYGLAIGAGVTNTEARTNSNNWRGAGTGPVDDLGTGTVL